MTEVPRNDMPLKKMHPRQAHEKVLDITNWHEFLQCLERAGFRGSKMISSDNAVLFTYAWWLFGRVDYRVPLSRLREVIARWFFMAQATGRYSGTFETQFERDTARLSDLRPGDADGYVRILSKTVDDNAHGRLLDDHAAQRPRYLRGSGSCTGTPFRRTGSTWPTRPSSPSAAG